MSVVERPTIKTISDMTGFSPSTVSLALRGGPRLSARTRQRVLDAAEAVGYVPDRLGVMLRTGKTNVVTLILDGAADTLDYSRYLMQGIGEAAAGTGYQLNVLPNFDHAKTTDLLNTVLSGRNCDGVIITHTSATDARIELLSRAGFPFVTHGRTVNAIEHSYHDYDSGQFVQLAFNRLKQQGRTRVALLVGDHTTYTYEVAKCALREAADGSDVSIDIIDGRTLDYSFRGMRKYGAGLIGPQSSYDGIICFNEMAAIALANGVSDTGESVGAGGRIGLVYKRTSDLPRELIPAADSIFEDIRFAGQELFRIIMARIAGTKASELQTVASPKPEYL